MNILCSIRPHSFVALTLTGEHDLHSHIKTIFWASVVNFVLSTMQFRSRSE